MPIAEYVTTCGRRIPPVASGVVMGVAVELAMLTVLTVFTEDLDLKVDSLSTLEAVVDDRVVVDVVDDDRVIGSRWVNAG